MSQKLKTRLVQNLQHRDTVEMLGVIQIADADRSFHAEQKLVGGTDLHSWHNHSS